MQRVHVVEVAEAGAIEGAQRRLNDVKAWLAVSGVEATCEASLSAGGVADHNSRRTQRI